MLRFLVVLVILTYVLNKLTMKYGLFNLTYKREISKKTVEIGEEFQITTTIENRKMLPITFLQVEEKYPKALGIENYNYNLFIMPYQRVKRTYNLSGNKRGAYFLRNVVLGIGDFAGFNVEHKEVGLLQEVLVLPKKLKLQEAVVPYGNFNGPISVKRWIIDDPLMTIGIREYTGYEPERYIHWPSSLRYGQLMVKNFDFTTDNSVLILLNVESMKPFWAGINEETLEKSISLCRGLMEELEEEKIPYGFTTNAYGINISEKQSYYPKVGQNHLNYLLETLSKISYGASMPFESLLEYFLKRKGNHTTFVVVTPRIFSSYIEPINVLTKTANRVVVISFQEENLNRLSNNIIKYVEG